MLARNRTTRSWVPQFFRFIFVFVCCIGPAVALERVSLQLRWLHQFQFAGYYAALHQGYYRDAGLQVTLKEGGPGADPVADVLAGKSDFGIGVSSLVVDYLKGKPVLLLGPVLQHSPNVLVVHGRNQRLVDLAGTQARKIALMGGEQDVELKAMFVDEGIALDKLHIASGGGHLDDFLTHRVEALNAYASNEPFQLDQLGVPYTVLKPQSYGMDFYGDVLFTHKGLEASRPGVVAAFRAATMQGWQYALGHPDKLIDLILTNYNSQNKTREHLAYEARELYRLVNPDVIEIGHNNPGRWQHIANTYQRFGMADVNRPLDDFFYQQDPKVDFSRFYWALAVAGSVVLVLAGVATFIHRVNRRLALTLDDKTRSEERHRIIFQTSASACIVWREGFFITDWNRQAEAMFGWTRQEVLGRPFTDFMLSESEQQRIAPELLQMVQKNALPHSVNDNLTRDGRVITCEWFSAWLPARPGEPREAVSLAIDITERKAHVNQLEHIAHFDALTNLPNRVLLADRLQQAMAQALRRGQQLAVVFLDLDGFKAINDHHGHEAGDQVLITLAKRMKEALREGDTLARLGGDEFVAVLSDLEKTSASLPLLNRLLSAAAQPVQVGTLSLQVSASLGITFYPQAHDIGADQLLRQADQAMYQAKLGGKNRYSLFDAVQDNNIRSHHESLERIRQAVENSEFVLHYQPKVNMHSGKVIGAEALIRWQHPEKGLLAPATFLPVIENHPLAVDVGEWVIDTALHQMTLWRTAGLELPVSINIGARQLQQGDFVKGLQAILAKHPLVHAGSIELEILETSALSDMDQVSQVIDECARMGVRFALDDFGTGYSSLTYLKRLRVALLKIDQSFVRDMLDDADDLAILQGIIGMAAAFKHEVIAEGVETVAHGTALLQLGCELAQGYGIAHPMPPDQLPAWAAKWQPDAAWVS
jgi:diguanylate cyclase (GGDEF)-like protein/PAS domain S-box-containing protein